MRTQIWILRIALLLVITVCLIQLKPNEVASDPIDLRTESLVTPDAPVILRNDFGEALVTIEIEDTESRGSLLDLNIDGKKRSLHVKSYKSADEAVWLNRKLADSVPFKGQKSYKDFDDDATAVIKALGKGLNVGQSWEAILPKDFMPGAYRNVFTTRELFRRIKKAGFDHVRIPVNFSNKTEVVAPWAIDAAFLDRYFANVDEALAEGLMVIVDNHNHGGFLNQKKGDKMPGAKLPRAEQLIRQSAMVAQVATRLNDYSFEKVLFEPENEPNGRFNKDWNAYWPDMLKACRAVNPKTIFLIGGSNYNSHETLKSMPEITDRRTALVAHVYTPHSFTHNNKHGKSIALWTDAGQKEMNAAFDVVLEQMATRGKPCVVTEIGVAGNVNNHHRNMYARDATNACMSRGIPFSYWNAYGDFGILHPSGFFAEGILEAIVGVGETGDYAIPPEPGSNAVALSKGLYGAFGSPQASIAASVIASRQAPTLKFTDTTITIMSEPTQRALILPYVVMKGGLSDAPREGRKFRFTVASTNPKSRFKLSLTDMQALTDNQGHLPFPKGANASSSPKWGDHSSGTYEYECYIRTKKDNLKHTSPIAFIFSASQIKKGDVITFKIEWLD